MKLTKEEHKELLEDIAADLPDGFAIFSPWTWLWLAQIVLMIWASAMLLIPLKNYFHVSYEFIYPTTLLLAACAAVIPNILIVKGKTALGTKYIGWFARLYIVLGFLSFNFTFPQVATNIMAIAFALITLLIINSVRFQVFLLHLKRMAEWGKERMKKNKVFNDKIKENRRRAGK